MTTTDRLTTLLSGDGVQLYDSKEQPFELKVIRGKYMGYYLDFYRNGEVFEKTQMLIESELPEYLDKFDTSGRMIQLK